METEDGEGGGEGVAASKLIGQAAGQGTRTSQSQTDTEEEGVCVSCVCMHVFVPYAAMCLT